MRLLKEDDTPLNNENNVGGSQTNQTPPEAVDLTQNKQQDVQNNAESEEKDTPKNWAEEYRKATATSKPLEVMKVIQQFLATLNFKNYDKNKFDEFVQRNSSSLRLECNKYGLSKDNPFFIFLRNYLDKGGTIDTFIDYNKWNILHNCIANGTLDTKQLAFTCEAKKQIRILVNPNLWGISPISDIKFCIEVYATLVDTNLDSFITNGYVKAAFAGDNPKNKSKKGFSTTLISAKMDEYTNTIGLLKCLFMTHYIEELDSAKININPETRKLDADGQSAIDRVRAEINKIKDKAENDLISGKLVSVDTIEHQYKILNENVQLSDIAIDGTRQKKDTDDVNTYNYNKDKLGKNRNNNVQKSSPTVNKGMRNMIASGNKYDNIINSIKNTLSLNNAKDVTDALTALLDLYKTRNGL